MTLLEQAKRMPLSSGVYLFLNKKGEVLYAGRAISLRKRVLNYFQKKPDPKLKEMVNSAFKIKFIKTENLLEAVILEANLIKKHWPKYNVREKDNRSFIYVVIPKGDYPKPLLARQREIKKIVPRGFIFGPYQSLSLVKKALRIIRKIFPYSVCEPFSGKPCFDYQIGLCPGLCVGRISKEDYRKNINNIILLLKGQKSRLIKKLESENPSQAQSLKHIQDVALISEERTGESFLKANRIEGYDISHLTGKETYGSMVVFIDGRREPSRYRLFKIKKAPSNDDLRALEEVIARRFSHLEWPFPDLVVIDGGKPQVDYIFKTLKKKNIGIPLIGISKFAGDKLVFTPKIRLSFKKLIELNKNFFLRIRNEAHRFALKSSRRRRQVDIFFQKRDNI